MYIYKIEIENFRNFQSFVWKPNPRVNVLFGHNGSGKTNLAEAFSLVFSTNNFEPNFDQSDYHLGDESKQIHIRVWINDVSELPTQISDHLQHIDENDQFVEDDTPGISRAVLIYQLESGPDRSKGWSFYQGTQQPPCKTQDRKAIDFIHIGADRQPTKEVGLQTRSTFYKMAKDAINPELERISKEIIRIANEKLAQSTTISTYLETLKDLGQIDLIDKYELLLKNPDSSWNSSGYELGTSVGDAKFSFERQSKGIQNIFLLLLMKKRLQGSGVVFIEELEQNLEPKYQRYITDEYKRLDVGQLFITSHSPDIISHFDYANMYSLISDKAVHLRSSLDPAELKSIHRVNKKEFISALMSTKVFLVEGDSEYESFPIYSYNCDTVFSKHDIEIVQIGGKGNFEQYIKIFKRFGKTVFVLLDNDSDAARQMRTASELADMVFVSQDSYEDLILSSVSAIVGELDGLVEFDKIKNKLRDLASYNHETSQHKDGKKKVVHDYIIEQGIDVENIASYNDLYAFEPLMCYILHDSFASAYFARAIAMLITELSSCPQFFLNLTEHISPGGVKLDTVNGYLNVFKLIG